MPLHHATGNLLDSNCQTLVNAVNCVGVAGAGLARQFRDRWPEQVAEYTAFCRAGSMRPGIVHEALLPDGRSILSVPTKWHYRNAARFEDVRLGIAALASHLRDQAVPSAAVPALGCGLGGLPPARVLAVVETALSGLPMEIYLYGFKKETL